MKRNNNQKELTVKQLEALLKKKRTEERAIKRITKKKTKKKATTKKATPTTESNGVSMLNLISLLVPFTFIALIVVGGAK